MEIQAVSVVPGRVRFRVPDVKRNPAAAQHWEQRLAAIKGVHRVAANPTTGSVLIHYLEEGIDWESLVKAFLPQAEPGPTDWRTFLLSVAETVAEEVVDPNQAIANAVHDLVQRLNRGLEAATGGANLRTLAPLAFLILGMGDLLLSKRAQRPPWFTLLWYAMSSFTKYNPPPGDEEEDADNNGEDFTLLEGAT